jgi:hypothetical protein
LRCCGRRPPRRAWFRVASPFEGIPHYGSKLLLDDASFGGSGRSGGGQSRRIDLKNGFATPDADVLVGCLHGGEQGWHGGGRQSGAMCQALGANDAPPRIGICEQGLKSGPSARRREGAERCGALSWRGKDGTPEEKTKPRPHPPPVHLSFRLGGGGAEAFGDASEFVPSTGGCLSGGMLKSWAACVPISRKTGAATTPP